MSSDNTECDYFRFLKKIKFQENIEIGSDIDINDKSIIRPPGYYRICTFRTLICEMFYNAVNFFPEVSEYSIIFSYGNKSIYIKFGYFDHLNTRDDKQTLVRIETDEHAFCLTRKHIYTFYVANRVVDPDYDIINAILLLLYINGKEPQNIKTDFVLNKKFINEFFEKKRSDFI